MLLKNTDIPPCVLLKKNVVFKNQKKNRFFGIFFQVSNPI
jgi:hypothetical protein